MRKHSAFGCPRSADMNPHQSQAFIPDVFRPLLSGAACFPGYLVILTMARLKVVVRTGIRIGR